MVSVAKVRGKVHLVFRGGYAEDGLSKMAQKTGAKHGLEDGLKDISEDRLEYGSEDGLKDGEYPMPTCCISDAMLVGGMTAIKMIIYFCCRWGCSTLKGKLLRNGNGWKVYN